MSKKDNLIYKLSIKKITLLSILMALGVVLKFFSIGDGEFRISFWDIPLFIAGMISGPIYGTICALGADLIYGLCFSSYPFSFIMMFTTVIWGFGGGLFYKTNLSKKTVLLYISVLITSIIATCINSLYLVLYSGGLGPMLMKLPIRIVVLLIKWPITSTMVYILYKKVFSKESIYQ